MTSPAYTDQQRRALGRRRGATAVDAGAGCGKTFVLTERFLSHLAPTGDEPPRDLERIVAITFTDAAAREMRDRIRKRCRQRLDSATPATVPFWRNLLRSLDGARVSTIHSFAAQLVRDHALALGVDPAFAVLDPADAAVLKQASIDDTLRALLAPREGRADEGLIDAAAEFDLRGLRERARALAESADSPGFARWQTAKPLDLVETWRKYYVEHVAKSYAEQVLRDPAVASLRELMAESTPTTPGFAERLDELDDALRTLSTDRDPDEALRRFRPLLNLSGSGKHAWTTKDWPEKSQKEAFTKAASKLRETLDKQRRAGSPESMLRAAELGLRVLGLASAAAKRYRAAKRERGVLDNDDLLVEAHRLLTAPELAEERGRVAGKVDVLLVDEFQDTDRLQSELVQAIVTPTDGDDETDPRALFYVGDFKQSIYRFRGAEPRVFQDLRERTPTAGRLTLSTNFRSQPAVLDFVNELFGHIFGEAYAPLRPQRPQVGPRPAVEFLWTPPPEDQPKEEESAAEAQRRVEAAAIAARIRSIIDSGEPIIGEKRSDRARPARPGDFALLFRALSDVASYETALREAGLEYYLVGGHAFYAQQEVYDVLNLLRAVQSECDDIALAGVLRSPFFGLCDEGLFWLAQRGGLNAGLFAGAFPKELTADDRQVATRARRVLATFRRDKDRVDAAELLRRAFDATGYDAALVAEFLGERKLGNLEKLHEQAREADASGSGLAGLTARLAEFVRTPPKEALASTTELGADVVRLMTVHASKGLEFPVVVLPDLNRKTRADQRTAAFDPTLGPLVRPAKQSLGREKDPPVGLDFWKATEQQLEREERDRLFYVACTRAADRLIVSACADPLGPHQGPWLQRLAERFDLATGALRESQGGAPLVTVTPLPPPASRAAATERSRLRQALEAIDTAPATQADLSGAGLISVRPEEVLTFSVSRLSGKLLRDSSSEHEEDKPQEDIDPRRLGNLVHAVIERLDPTAKDQAQAITRWSRALAPCELRRNVEAGAAAAADLVNRFVTTREWQAMREARTLLREADFVLHWPAGSARDQAAVIRGRFDALFQDAKGDWRVVDYKTNSVKPAGVAKLAAHYALQMAIYAHAIEAAYGARPASLSLVFLAAGVTHDVPWNDAVHAASATAITSAIEQARRAAAETTE